MKAIEYKNMIRERAIKEGHEKGRKDGIKILIISNMKENIPKIRIIENLQSYYGLGKEEAEEYYIEYSLNQGNDII